jgi:DNA-binding transcriptional ArsR family regulator
MQSCAAVDRLILKHMLNDSLKPDSAVLNRAFQALSDPIRRGMLARLARAPASVSELAAPLPISLPAVLQHLQALEASGLIATHKTGRVRICRIEPKALSAAEAWIAEQRAVWDGRLDRFESYVEELQTKENDQ